MRRPYVVILAVGLIILGIAGTIARASAEEQVASLRIAPLRSYPVLTSGSSTAGKVSLTNKSNSELTVDLSIENFKTINDNYDYAFAATKEAEWVRFAADSVVLGKQESREMAYSLAVPIDASPGGHYFALVATVSNRNNKADINEIHRVVSLVYLEVGGAVNRHTQLTSVDLPWFTTSGRVNLQASIADTGNTHSRARLGISQQTLPFGKKVIIDQSEALILPSTSRRLTNHIKLANLPAIYRFQAVYAPVQGGKQVITRYLIYVPVWIFILVPLFVYWLYWEWRRFSRHHKSKKEPQD